MPIEVTETHWFKDRCQGKHTAEDGTVYQCGEVTDHMGSHSAAVSAAQVLLWPSEAEIEEARADAEFNELTPEQVMFTLTGGDEEKQKEVEQWAAASAKFVQVGFQMRKEIDELRKELAGYKEREAKENGQREGNDP